MNRSFSRTLMPLVKVSGALHLALLSISYGQAPSQQQPRPATKGAVLKGKAPVNKELLKVKLLRPKELRLKNGLQVMILENHKLPNFTMQMVILSGGMVNSDDSLGVAQYTAQMLREGTATRSSKQLAEQIDQIGATVTATAGLSSLTTTVSASGLVSNLDQVLELFADIILNPAFPAEELQKLKIRNTAAIRFQRAQADFLAQEMLNKAVYGSHPGSRYALKAEQIQRITPEALRKFHAAFFKPNNTIFAIAGDVNAIDIIRKLEKRFGDWQSSEVPMLDTPKVNEAPVEKIYLVDRPGSVQSNLLLGSLALQRDDPDYIAVEVLNQILGAGPSSRLFLNLREDKGYTYGAYSQVLSFKYKGALQANAEVRTEVTKGSLNELIYELNRIRDDLVLVDEIDRAKRTLIGGWAIQLEFPQASLQNAITSKLYGFPVDYWDKYPQQVFAITREDIQRVARKYIDLAHLQIVVVGDANKLAEMLTEYAPVDIYDTEGKLVRSLSARK